MIYSSTFRSLNSLQLSKDSFMQQVQYGYQLSDELKENSSSDQEQQQQLKESLLAQLSHSDGIRGFMVSYLTGEGDDTVADEEEIPAILYKVLQEQGKKNPDELIPLACECVFVFWMLSTISFCLLNLCFFSRSVNTIRFRYERGNANRHGDDASERGTIGQFEKNGPTRDSCLESVENVPRIDCQRRSHSSGCHSRKGQPYRRRRRHGGCETNRGEKHGCEVDAIDACQPKKKRPSYSYFVFCLFFFSTGQIFLKSGDTKTSKRTISLQL